MRKSRKDWDPAGTHEPLSDVFMDAYLEAALWSSVGEEGTPLDETYTEADFSKEAVAQAIEETNDFIRANEKDLDTANDDYGYHGHDFWLTRNGHGTGFWDRGYGAVGERLAKAAKIYGEADVYVGDDGALHFS